MQNRGIGLGSSPIGNEGFCTPLSKAKAFPPLLRGGRVVGKNWNISKRVCVSPPTHRNISAKKAKNIWFMMVSPEPGWMHACIYIYIYVCIYVCMYVCMFVCMYVRRKWKGLPYHLWAKMWHPEDPPHFCWKPKNMWGGYISCGQVKYFWEISCPTPLNIPELKGGMPKRSKTKLALVL